MSKFLLILFLFLHTLFGFVAAYKTYTTETADYYRTYTTENPDLCSPLKKRKIKFPRGLGIFVHQTRLQDHTAVWERNFFCKFQLDATQDKDGIFAVIQNAILRQNATTGECIDYIQFRRHDASPSKKYCGNIQMAISMDPIFALETSLTERFSPTGNSYIDPKGQMDVEIFVSREKLQPDEEMDLKIVFTSFRKCTQKAKYDRACSDLYYNFCINERFFDDEYVNCPFPDCTDEDGCSDKEDDFRREKTHYNSIGNKVLLGSVSTLLIMFGIFITCLWICKQYGKLCWADEFAHPNNGGVGAAAAGAQNPSAPDPSRVVELQETAITERRPSAPNAPPIAQCDNDPSKDMPPSYDSLFPER